jgi:hypothetical protein
MNPLQLKVLNFLTLRARSSIWRPSTAFYCRVDAMGLATLRFALRGTHKMSSISRSPLSREAGHRGHRGHLAQDVCQSMRRRRYAP